MKLRSYIESFIVSIVAYVSIVSIFLFTLKSSDFEEKISNTKPLVLEIIDIPIQKHIIEPVKEQLNEEKIDKNQLEQKKVVEKKFVEKKVIEKKVVSKQIKIKKVTKKTKPIINKKQVEQKQPLIQDNKTKSEQQKTALLKKQREKYFERVKQTINIHKSYPKVAKRRGIQGDVKIEFMLTTEGELVRYSILEGKSIFKKSIEIAMKNSFPLKPEKNIFKDYITLSLLLKYRIK